jgi:hypothetical protein
VALWRECAQLVGAAGGRLGVTDQHELHRPP